MCNFVGYRHIYTCISVGRYMYMCMYQCGGYMYMYIVQYALVQILVRANDIYMYFMQQKKYENFSEAGKGHRLDEDTRFHQHPDSKKHVHNYTKLYKYRLYTEVKVSTGFIKPRAETVFYHETRAKYSNNQAS